MDFFSKLYEVRFFTEKIGEKSTWNQCFRKWTTSFKNWKRKTGNIYQRDRTEKWWFRKRAKVSLYFFYFSLWFGWNYCTFSLRGQYEALLGPSNLWQNFHKFNWLTWLIAFLRTATSINGYWLISHWGLWELLVNIGVSSVCGVVSLYSEARTNYCVFY